MKNNSKRFDVEKALEEFNAINKMIRDFVEENRKKLAP